MKRTFLLFAAFLLCCTLKFELVSAQADNYYKEVDRISTEINNKVIEWRRDIHQNPELSNREFKTAEKVASHLKSLGIEVQTGVAMTGVVGVLKGGKPGPVVALRADMDALPVTERVDIPFASKVKSTYNNIDVGVMHACGHDTHVAMLMGAAEVLSRMKDDLKGTVKFIFQPAEEGAPEGEEGGAELMVKEGVLESPKVDAIFGLHINSMTPVGQIKVKTEGILAAADRFKIKVNGKQTHGSTPWTGLDPIVTSSQIVMGLQTIVSRQLPLTQAPAVVSVGGLHSGVRNNIIPESAEMYGTIRTFDEGMQETIHKSIERTAKSIAESAGLTADVTITKGYPVTFNHVDLTNNMLPTLKAAAGENNVQIIKAITGAEDFSFFQKEVPGMFFFLGGMSLDKTPDQVAPHHTPDFFIDESGMQLGVKTFCYLVYDYLNMEK